MKINLYEELVKTLSNNNKTVDDILYVMLLDRKAGQKYYKPDRFLKRAKNINYNNSRGEMRNDLTIVLKNGDFIIRGNSDGFEWFEYMKLPKTDVELEDLPDSVHLDYFKRESKVSPLD